MQQQRTFAQFVSDVQALLEGTAAGKGYSAAGVNGQNQLYEFVQAVNGGHQHAIGELVYKITRYAAQGNPEDLAKIGAWSYLIWKHQSPTRP